MKKPPAVESFAATSTPGSVAEWSIAPVLKTGDGKPSVSSNLTASAKERTLINYEEHRMPQVSQKLKVDSDAN